MRPSGFAVPGVLAFLTACAPVADGPGPGSGVSDASPRARQCFSVSQVENFEQGRPHQIYLRVGRGDVYELSAAAGCPDLDFASQIALIPDGGLVGTRLCSGDWARIVAPDRISPDSVCRVRVSRRLTADEIAALPANHRP